MADRTGLRIGGWKKVSVRIIIEWACALCNGQEWALRTPKTKENRIYIRGEFTRKKCKTAIFLYCFHPAGVLHIFVLYKLLGPGTSFYRKSKIIIKRKPNYEIGWFHNWPMIISHRLYAFHFTNENFPL